MNAPPGTSAGATDTVDLTSPVVVPKRLPAISPLIAAGSRFPVGTGNPEGPAELGPVHLRTFLLRTAESHDHGELRRGATPKATSHYDGTKDDSSEEFNQPDFSP